MALFLSPYIGQGTKADPFRPRGLDQPGSSAIDIRLDPTRADGKGIPYALLWLPSGIPDPTGAKKLADDYGESVSALIKTLSNTKLGLDFSRDSTIQDIVETILLRPDRDGWKSLRPAKGIYECWLGSGSGKRDWIGLPSVAGGSITDNFNRANESPVAAPWTKNGTGSNLNLTSNALAKPLSGDDVFYYYSGSWNNDQSSQVLYVSAFTDDDWGPAVRIGSGGTLNGYFYDQYNGGRVLLKWVSGSLSVIESPSGATATGVPYKLDVAGSTIRYYDNGVEHANSPATDTSLTSGSPGVFVYGPGGSLDDFLATGEVASGGGSLSYQPHPMRHLVIR